MARMADLSAQQDSANEMWNIYLDEVKEDDKRIADAWKEGSSGILVFTGLFSTIVAAFVIEFYKTLSPNSGDQTVALLGQISKQLANSPNGTYPSTANQSSPPSASMIWVISMWLISLVLSLASALIASLLQEWARSYIETANVPGMPNHRAFVRSFLFLGTERYQMRNIVRMAFSLLHASVYLFFGGLVILFHTINKKVAIAVDITVGLFALAYLVLSILPCLDDMCPYRTPMTIIMWRQLHTFLIFAAICLRSFVELLHACLVPLRPGDEDMTHKQRVLVGWMESLEIAIRRHWRYLFNGFGDSIIYDAINAGGDEGRKIVTGLFNLFALSDGSKLLKFAASIPRNRILELVPLIKSGEIVLREPLRVLLQSCEAGTHAAGLDEGERKRALLVCLDAIHHIAKAPDVPDLNFVRSNFANIDLMRALWIDGDTDIRFTSRSICALLAKRVLREPLEEPQLRWLQDVTGQNSWEIYNADLATRDRMNLKSFVYGVLSNQVGDPPTEPAEDATPFKETLAILLNVDDAWFDSVNARSRLSEEVGWIQRQNPHGSHEVVDKLYTMFPFLPGEDPISPSYAAV